MAERNPLPVPDKTRKMPDQDLYKVEQPVTTKLKRLVPYLLVVAACWGGTAVWYEQNEDRREQAIADITTESYSEDVDSCQRVNATVRDPAHQFFVAIRQSDVVKKSIPDVYEAAVRAEATVKGQPCLDVVGQPEGARPYEPDKGEVSGIPKVSPHGDG